MSMIPATLSASSNTLNKFAEATNPRDGASEGSNSGAFSARWEYKSMFSISFRRALVILFLIVSTFRICNAQSANVPAQTSAPGPRGRFLYAATTDIQAILEFRIAPDGAVIGPKYFPVPGSPTMVVADPGGKFLFAIEYGGILAFTIDPSNGALTQIPSSLCCGFSLPPTALGIDPNGNFLYVTLNDPGSAALYSYQIDRSSGALTLVSGTGLYFAAAPQPTSIQTDALGKFVYLVDPATGVIAGYPVNLANGQLGRALFPMPFAAGLGATLISTSPNFLYVFARDQIANLIGYRIDETSGRLWPVPGALFTSHGRSWGNYMTIDPVHNVLYQPSGGSLAVYRLQKDGALRFQNLTAVGQANTGSLLVDASGTFLFAVGSSSGIEMAPLILNSYRIHPITGDLEFVGQSSTFSSLNSLASLAVAP
jgi:6-phosphogluconolactonase (cycloisomerase 2 family)